MPYAAQTRVSIAQSKTDIEALLARSGATGFGYVTEGVINDNKECLLR